MTPREINAKIAVEIMGYVWFVDDHSRSDGKRRLETAKWVEKWVKGGRAKRADGSEPIADLDVPDFSTNISDAFLVVDRMREKGWMLTLMNWNYYGETSFTAKFRNSDLINNEFEVKEKTAPMAICLAALATVVVEVK